MGMTRELKRLYEQYDTIQGDNPIPLGNYLPVRIGQKHYKELNMRQIVGMLQHFVDCYESESQPRNSRYAVRFMFHVRNSKINGPLLIIMDTAKERCADILEWNGGDIQSLGGELRHEYMSNATRDYYSAMQDINLS